jgi:hypothetical protein
MVMARKAVAETFDRVVQHGRGLKVPSDALRRALDAVKPACRADFPASAPGSVLVSPLGVKCVSRDLTIFAALHSAERGADESFAVPFARLHAIARECSGNVSIRVGENSVEFRAGASCWTLGKQDPSVVDSRDCGLVPGGDGEKVTAVCRLPADQFSRCLSCVLPVAGSSDASSRWGGVKIETTDSSDGEDKVVHFTATDGRRLHTCSATFEQAVDDCSALITAEAAKVVCLLAAKCSDAVQVCLGAAGSVVFTIGDVSVRATQLAHSFPKWREVIPSRRPNPTTVAVAEMLTAVRQAAIVTSEASKAVAFSFNGKISLRGRSAEYGESAVEVVPIDHGCTAKVWLDPRYVADFLSHVASIDASATVSIDAASAESAVVLLYDTATAVVMPMEGDDGK